MAQPNFKFTGEVSIPKSESKKPFFKSFTKDDIAMASMNFGIKESKNNMGFVECFGSIPKDGKIKTKDNDGNDIEIKWNDRKKEDVIKTVAYYRRFIIDLGEDFGGRQEFICAWDAINFLKDNLANYKGKVCVTGQMQKQWYNDKYYDKFQLNNVYAVDEETKNRLFVTTDIFYRKDCIDKEDWKEKKIISIDGYVQVYVNKTEGNKFMPQRFVFNASKINPDNERHKKLLDYKLKYVDEKSKKWGHLLWETIMINGAEEVDFDESQLTDAQREQIELGIKTLEDFKPNGSIFGERIVEYRLLEPVLKKVGNEDFSNGFIECDMTDDEFEEQIYIPAKDEKLSDVMKDVKDEIEDKDVVDNKDEDDDDLFS